MSITPSAPFAKRSVTTAWSRSSSSAKAGSESAAGYGYECSAEVMGSLATVRIDRPRRVNNEWLTPGLASFDRLDDFRELFEKAYLLELEDFAAAIHDDRAPAVTGEDALAAFLLARACERSRRESRTVTPERADLVSIG